MADDETDIKVTSLDEKRAAEFLRRLVDDPFVAIIVTDEADPGGVSIYSKGLTPEHLARIREVLIEIEQEQDGTEERR